MINCQWTPEELAHHLDAASKRYIAKNNIQLYTIDAIDLAQKIGMGKMCIRDRAAPAPHPSRRSTICAAAAAKPAPTSALHRM